MAAIALDHLGGEGDVSTAGEGGDEGDLVAGRETGGFAVERVNLDLVHVHADVGGELAFGVADLGSEAGELGVEVVHDLAQIPADGAHAHTVAHEVAEGSGDVDVDGHRLCLAVGPLGAIGLWSGSRRRARGRH